MSERINCCWSDPIRYGRSQHSCLWTTRRQLSFGCDELLVEMHDALQVALLVSAAAERDDELSTAAPAKAATMLQSCVMSPQPGSLAFRKIRPTFHAGQAVASRYIYTYITMAGGRQCPERRHRGCGCRLDGRSTRLRLKNPNPTTTCRFARAASSPSRPANHRRPASPSGQHRRSGERDARGAYSRFDITPDLGCDVLFMICSRRCCSMIAHRQAQTRGLQSRGRELERA
jgi:hypothetical protein